MHKGWIVARYKETGNLNDEFKENVLPSKAQVAAMKANPKTVEMLSEPEPVVPKIV
jgi:hypothetical protein